MLCGRRVAMDAPAGSIWRASARGSRASRTPARVCPASRAVRVQA